MNVSMQPRSILLVGLIRSLAQVKLEVAGSIARYCGSGLIAAYHLGVHEDVLPAPRCGTAPVSIRRLQAPPRSASQGDLAARLARMAFLRSAQRKAVVAMVVASKELLHQVRIVLVLDLDVNALPRWPAVFEAAEMLGSGRPTHAAAAPRRHWDVLCANGYEIDARGRRRTYDTLPLVLENGTWMYDPVQRRRLGQRLPSVAHYNALAGRGGRILPVRSCFGGLALLRFDVWSDQSCDYTSPFPSGME